MPIKDGDIIDIGTAKFQTVDMIPRNILLRNKAYQVGDIAYTSALPSYLRLECVQAGTTGVTEPTFPSVAGGY